MNTKDLSRKQNTINGFVSMFIVLIYTGLVVFGLVSFLEPNWLKELSGTGRVSEAVTMHTYGDQFLSKQEYDIAITQYKKALRINPDMVEAWINLGVALKQKKDYEEALLAFNKALEYPDVPHDATYYNMAEIYQEQNRPEDAVAFFLKSAGSAAFPMVSFQKAGEILNNKGNWQQAFDVFNKALENAYTMKNLYVGMLKRDYHLYDDTLIKYKILSLQEEGVEQVPWSIYDEKTFLDALSRDPNLASIYNQFGYTFAMTGDYQRAVEYFNKALQIKPDFQNARSNLNAAWNKINMGQQP